MHLGKIKLDIFSKNIFHLKKGDEYLKGFDCENLSANVSGKYVCGYICLYSIFMFFDALTVIQLYSLWKML